jgi:hypothetical protein
MRWTRVALLTRALSCGRRSRVVLTPRRRRQVSQKCLRGDGDKKARSPGRARNKLLKPLRAGMPGDPGATVVTNARAFYTPRAAAGATGTRHSPRPLLGEESLHNSGVSRRGNAKAYLAVIARSEATKQSRLSVLLPHGLLRFARNDGKVSGLPGGACHRREFCADPLARNDGKWGSFFLDPSHASDYAFGRRIDCQFS